MAPLTQGLIALSLLSPCAGFVTSAKAARWAPKPLRVQAPEKEEVATTTSRLDDTIIKCRENNEAAFVSFVTAGYPHPDDTIDILLALEEGGTDIIELGVPFSDPQADGATIQGTNQVTTLLRPLSKIPQSSHFANLSGSLLYTSCVAGGS